MQVVQKKWPWAGPLEPRSETLYICIHHTDGPQMQLTDEIFQEHLNEGWVGIGYNRVIKGDGLTVQGRPDNCIGAHALGINQCSVGIALEGNFQGVDTPTNQQLAALKDNLEDYLLKYPQAKIIGHRDVAAIIGDPSVATDCPGDTLYSMLPAVIQEVGGMLNKEGVRHAQI